MAVDQKSPSISEGLMYEDSRVYSFLLPDGLILFAYFLICEPIP